MPKNGNIPALTVADPKKLSIRVFIATLVSLFVFGGTSVMASDKRKDYAQKILAEHPELFSEDHRSLILDGIITLGMTPFEVKLAGGAFIFRIVADPDRWPKGSNPYRVMWAQSTSPDNSEITMTFENDRQFPLASERAFRVHFVRGLATQIEQITETNK